MSRLDELRKGGSSSSSGGTRLDRLRENAKVDEANNMISSLDKADGAYYNRNELYQQRADDQALSDEAQMAQAQQAIPTLASSIKTNRPYEAVDVPDGTTFDAVGPNALRINPSSLNRDSLYTQEEPAPKTFVTDPAMETISYGLQGLTQPIRDLGEALPNSGFSAPKLGEPTFISPTASKVAETGGQLIGMLPGFEGAYATGGRAATSLLRRAVPEAPKLLQSGTRGAGAGLAYGTGAEGLDAAFDTRQDGQQSMSDRLKNIAMTTVGGALGDAAFTAAGQGLRKGLQGFRNRDVAPIEPVQTGSTRLDEIRSRNQQQPTAVDEPVQPASDAATAEPMRQNWFTNLFGNQGVGISAFGSTKRISKDPLTTAQQIVKNPLKQDIVGVKAQLEATARAGYQNYIDTLSPLKHISRQTYDKAMDAARANNIANVIVDDKFVTPEGVAIGEGLGNTFRKVGRGQMEKFLDYIVLRHANTRMGRGEKVYADNLSMTPEKAQARLDDYDKRFPEFTNIAREWDQFNENMLKTYGVDEDLLSEDMFKLLREQNPNYAPMRRQFTTSEKFASPFSMGSKPAFSGQKSPIKEVSPTGSVRRIVDPRRSAIEATGAWVNAAMRNRVMKSIVDRVRQDPEGMKDVVEIVQPAKGQANLKQILADEGSEGFLESLNTDFNNLFKRTRLDQDNVVRAMMKGEPVYLKVNNPEAVKALVGMGSEQSNVIMDFFGQLSNATKYGATGALAPMFAVKSLTADVAQSLIQSKHPAAHLWDLGHAAISSIANTLPKNTPGFNALRALAEEYRRTGGQYSAVLRGDRPLNTSVRRLDRDPLLSPKGIAKGAASLVASPFKALNRVADIAENVNRMAAYKGEIRKLGGERTPDNITKAMGAAREITTNYSRRGNQSQTIEKFVPYSNAAVQGMHRFVRQWKENPFKTAAFVGGAVLLPKATEYLMFGQDPDYQNIPARDKYRNIIISKNSDGTFVKVPMPPEYNALGAFMVDSLEYFKDQNPTAFKGFSDAMANIYTPPQVSGLAQPLTQGGGAEVALTGGLGSTVLAPAVSVISNRDFAGRPIEPMALSDRSPQYRYDERTSSIAKKLGQVLNMSPKKVDYLIRSYGGDPARILMPMTSEVGRGDIRNSLLKNFIIDPTFTSNLTNDFYAAKEMINHAYRDNKEVGVPLPAWYDDELRNTISSTAKGSLSTRLSDLSDQKKAVSMDKSITSEQRTEKLRAIQRNMNEIYLEINTKVSEKDVPIPRR